MYVQSRRHALDTTEPTVWEFLIRVCVHVCLHLAYTYPYVCLCIYSNTIRETRVCPCVRVLHPDPPRYSFAINSRSSRITERAVSWCSREVFILYYQVQYYCIPRV